MSRQVWISLLLLGTISCQTKPVAKTDMELVQGDWVLAGFKTDPTAKGTLTLKPDSTFTGIMDSEKAKAAGTQPKDNSLVGTFSLSRVVDPQRSTLFIDFVITGPKPPGSGTGAGFRLSYDQKDNVFTDLLMMYFARPEELEKVNASLNYASEARRGPGK